jgi:hyperosmotically inducible protein
MDRMNRGGWIVLALGATLALAGCDKPAEPTRTEADKAQSERTKEAREDAKDAAEVANANADNTKKNERDREPSAVTPLDQKENEVDRGITQRIRQGVMDLDGLSMNARNVKIVTADGVVTLRGPVKSDKEKADIAALAEKVEGVKKVDNQLEVEVPNR